MKSNVAITMTSSAYTFLMDRAERENKRVLALLKGVERTVQSGSFITIIWKDINWNEGWNRDVDSLLLWLRPFNYRKQIIGEDLDDLSFEDNVPLTEKDNEEYAEMDELINAAPYISREFAFDN